MDKFESWVDWSQYHDLRAELMGRQFGRMSFCYFHKQAGADDEFIDANTFEVVPYPDVEIRTKINYGHQKYKEQLP